MNINSNSLYGASSYTSYGNSTNTTSNTSRSSQFAEALLTSLDSDSSGAVDSTEFSSAALALSIDDESAISNAFSGLDSDGDGEISADEFSSLFTEESSRVAGGMPPPPPPSSSGSDEEEDTGYTADELTAMAKKVSSTDTNLASLLATVAQNFDAADTNEDGKVTAAEAMSYQQSTQQTTDTTEASTVAASGSMPPPPPSASSVTSTDDTGFTQDELLSMVDEVSSSDSKLASLFQTLADNFDKADADSDGKVTSAEAKAYKETTKSESINSQATQSQSTEDSMMKALLAQIISNYATQNSISNSSVSFSA